MKSAIQLTPKFLSNFETLAFAGGGNRCWWQGGMVEQLMTNGWRLPRQLVGTSAGAAVAAACLSAGPAAAFDACRQLYATNRQLGLKGSVAAATLAYLLDKKLLHSIHPQLPRFMGLRQGFFKLSQCSSAADARTLLQGAAAALPFMPAQRVAGRWAMDGGYIDNAPLPTQTPAEKAKTLVLLTRHYPQLPTLFQWRGRSYWQPSRPVPVSTWDCRPATTVSDAFELGRADAKRWLSVG